MIKNNTSVNIPSFSLSSMVTLQETSDMVLRRQTQCMTNSRTLSVTAKRMCFAALRELKKPIRAEDIFIPTGMSVGEFSLTQVQKVNRMDTKTTWNSKTKLQK
jgi:hypothetical protein